MTGPRPPHASGRSFPCLPPHLRALLVAFLVAPLVALAPVGGAKASLVWERYDDWSYFENSGWWLNCQIMTTGEAGYALALKAQVDGPGGPARQDLLLINDAIDLTASGEEALDLTFELKNGDRFEAVLSVRRPSLAGREIVWNWPGTAILAGGGSLVVTTASGQRLDRFSLEGFAAAQERFARCVSGEAAADQYLN